MLKDHKKRHADTASIFLTVVGLYLAAVSLLMIIQEHRLFLFGHRIQTTAASFETPEDSPYFSIAVMKFTVGPKSYTLSDDGTWGFKPKLNDNVSVIYDPQDPYSSRPLYDLAFCSIEFLLGLALIGMSIIWRRKLATKKYETVIASEKRSDPD